MTRLRFHGLISFALALALVLSQTGMAQPQSSWVNGSSQSLPSADSSERSYKIYGSRQ